MTNTHPCTECSALLHADLKAFSRWLEEAGIDLDSQVNTMDTRTHSVTQEQGEVLAHGRMLQITNAKPADVPPDNADTLLVERVALLEHQTRQISDQFNELVITMRIWRMALGRQDVRLSQRDDVQSTQISALAEQISAPTPDQEAQGSTL